MEDEKGEIKGVWAMPRPPCARAGAGMAGHSTWAQHAPPLRTGQASVPKIAPFDL